MSVSEREGECVRVVDKREYRGGGYMVEVCVCVCVKEGKREKV